MKTQNANLQMYFEVFVDGKRIGKRQKSRSFVKAFANFIYVLFSHTSPATTPDITNTAISIAAAAGDMQMAGLIDSSANGTVVGTGTTAVTTADIKLGTLIATGNGAGQLRYLAMTYNLYSVNSTDVTFQITRSFINNSGSTITPTEVGFYAVDGAGHTFCIVRDLFSGGGVAVAAGKTLTVTYTFSFPV